MPILCIPYQESKLDVYLSDDWQVHECPIQGAPGLTPEQLLTAFHSPQGTCRLRDLATGKGSAAVIVEDTTRPTPTHLIAPLVVEELVEAGIPEEAICFFSAIAAHRPQLGYEFCTKLGTAIVDRFRTYNHNFYDQLDFIGISKLGTPIYLNSLVNRCDMKITIGSVIPHTHAGFSGGAKSLMPGVCGAKTVTYHHSVRPRSSANSEEGGDYRADIEDIADICGLDFVADSVINEKCEIVGLYTGDLRLAHRAATRLARQVYQVKGPPVADAAIVSAYPIESDFIQASKGILAGTGALSVKAGGPVLLIASCPEGAGHHYIGSRGGYYENLHADALAESLASRRLLVYSPNLRDKEVDYLMPPGTLLFRDLEEALDALGQLASGNHLNVFPQGALAVVTPSQ
ncbi:MAG: lactate racemase domain-containing protein [bacterium]